MTEEKLKQAYELNLEITHIAEVIELLQHKLKPEYKKEPCFFEISAELRGINRISLSNSEIEVILNALLEEKRALKMKFENL